MRNKKSQIIIIVILLVIIACGIFLAKKIEAPKIVEENVIKNTKELQIPEKSIPAIKEQATEKYKIVNRSVVAPENILNKSKVVLLTIDDGPGPRTKDMMDILNKHNAKAIFFINGIHDKGYPGVIEETAKEGFAIGNHTWDHMNLKKQKDVNIAEGEINKDTELIKKLTGTSPRFFRAPYGESNTLIRKYVKDNGMIFMDWSDAAKDWEKSTVEKDIFVGNVMNNIHPGSIILIHEHPWSVANLDALLTMIESKGYTYVDPKDIIE